MAIKRYLIVIKQENEPFIRRLRIYIYIKMIKTKIEAFLKLRFRCIHRLLNGQTITAYYRYYGAKKFNWINFNHFLFCSGLIQKHGLDTSKSDCIDISTLFANVINNLSETYLKIWLTA